MSSYFATLDILAGGSSGVFEAFSPVFVRVRLCNFRSVCRSNRKPSTRYLDTFIEVGLSSRCCFRGATLTPRSQNIVHGVGEFPNRLSLV
jgi:hypothetical protein